MTKENVSLKEKKTATPVNVPYILVQTPISLSEDQKTEIVNDLKAQYPLSPVTFSVNKNLIGGLRVLIDGKAKDYSWLSIINKFTTNL